LSSAKNMKPKGLQNLVSACITILLFLVTVNTGSAQNDTNLEHNMENPLISKVDIEITAIQDNKDKWVAIAKDLVQFQSGEIFSSKKLNLAKASLKSSGFFKNIEVKTHTQDNGMVAVTIFLAPFPLIQDIIIEGSFPVFEREVLNAMTLYTGEPFNKEMLPAQEEAIVHLLENNGYIHPHVKIFEEKESNDKLVVNVDIDKDVFYYTRQVNITGNQAFSDIRLKVRTDTWQSSLLPASMSRFIQKEFDEDVKNLTAFYRNNDFPDVNITPEIEKNAETGEVVINFLIDEGDCYEITFHGNEEFWDWTLKDELTPFKKGNRRNIGLRKSIRNIKERYQKAGYTECSVKTKLIPGKPINKNIRHIRFFIEEGPRSIVKNLKIEGNLNIPEDKIRDQILTRPPELFSDGEFVSQILENDIQAIKALYLKEGYMAVNIDRKIAWQQDDKLKVNFVDITLLVEEGKKVTVTSIDFKGMNAMTEEEALQSIILKPGRPFREYLLKDDSNRLAAAVSEKGYPHVVVKEIAEVSHDKTKAKIVYSVTEGPFVKMGNIHAVGNFRTSDSIILEEMELEKDMPFSMIKMLESQRNIKNINAFETARTLPIGLKEKADRVHLMVEVEEKKPYSVQVGLGYDTSRHLYFNTRAGDQNLLGLNKEAWISLEVSEIGQKGETGIFEPRFLGTHIMSSFTIFGEKREEFNQDFGTISQGTVLSFSKKLPYDLTAGLAFSLERKEQFLRDERLLLPEEEEEYEPRTILVTTPSIAYDAVDSFFRPQKGIHSSLQADISSGLENSLDDFIKYQYEIKLYYTFFQRLTFALRGHAGHIIPFNKESNIPNDQLFYLGGLTDVRGYNENMLRFDGEGKALGGRTSLSGSIEARFDAGFNIEIAPFFDTGSIRNTITNEGSDEFRSSVGIGLRYLFPYLPVGVQYGHKLNRKKHLEDAGRFYVTIGYIF